MYLRAAKTIVAAQKLIIVANDGKMKFPANNDFDGFSSHSDKLLITKFIHYPMQIRVVGNLIGDSVQFRMTAKDWYIPREPEDAPRTNNNRPVVIGSTNHLLEERICGRLTSSFITFFAGFNGAEIVVRSNVS